MTLRVEPTGKEGHEFDNLIESGTVKRGDAVLLSTSVTSKLDSRALNDFDEQ